jgi:hypothetical protein
MGSSSITGDETILFADNMSFDGTPRGGKLTQDAELFLGATNAPHIRKSTLVSGDGSVTFAFSEPTATTAELDIRAAVPISPTNSTGTYNLMLDYDAGTGTGTIKGANGVDLSALNIGYVTLHSNVTPGHLVTVPMTSNFIFLDANNASSAFAGSLFDLNTGDITTVGIPFYIYAVLDSNDENLTFAVSRVPSIANTLTTSTFNGASGGADLSYFLLLLETVSDIADYNNENKLQMIGSMLMNIDGSDDWEVYIYNHQAAAQFSYKCGIGSYLEGSYIQMQKGICGARANSFFADNGGTAPETPSDTPTNSYKIDPFTREVLWDFEFGLLAGSPAGEVAAVMMAPIKGLLGRQIGFFGGIQPNGFPQGAQINDQKTVFFIRARSDSSGFADTRYFILFKGDNTSAQWTYAEIAAMNRRLIRGTVRYGI